MLNVKLLKIDNEFLYKSEEINSTSDSILLIQNLSIGICGTDIDIARNGRSDIAQTLGHEGIGRVIELYNEDCGFEVGDLIVYNPVSPKNQHRILGHSYEGIFQQFRIISKEDIEHSVIVKLPNQIAIESWYGALLEPLGVSIYAYEIISRHFLIKDVLILGTGAIAHVLAYFLIKKNCTVKMLTRSLDRAHQLNVENKILGISYGFIDSQRSHKIYDTIFCCSTRDNAILALKYALSFADSNTVIDLVNGFNQDIHLLADDVKDEEIELNNIRRTNFCGKSHEIWRLKGFNKPYITGHRGCASPHHYIKSLEEISRNETFYKALIRYEMPFAKAKEFFNNMNFFDNKFYGKILINVKDKEYV